MSITIDPYDGSYNFIIMQSPQVPLTSLAWTADAVNRRAELIQDHEDWEQSQEFNPLSVLEHGPDFSDPSSFWENGVPAAQKNSFTCSVSGVAISAQPSNTPNAPVRAYFFMDASVSVISEPGWSTGWTYGDTRGPFLRSLTVKAVPVTPVPDLFTVVKEVPQTTELSTTTTNSMSDSFGGSLGLFGKAGTATLDGSVTFSKSVSVTIPDFLIIDNSGSSAGVPEWTIQNSLVGNDDRIGDFSTSTLEQEFAWEWECDFEQLSQAAPSVFTFNMVFSFEYQFDSPNGPMVMSGEQQIECTINRPSAPKPSAND
jgi:hypothetical protein